MSLKLPPGLHRAEPAVASRSRRRVAQLLQASFSRVTSLTAQARRLRVRVANATLYARLRACVDALLHELRTAARELAVRAATLGRRLDARRVRPAPASSSRQKKIGLPEKLAGALLAKCQACGVRVCELMQTAQAAHDDASIRVAYSVMRRLEKQLWIFRPYALGTAHPFTFSAHAA